MSKLKNRDKPTRATTHSLVSLASSSFLRSIIPASFLKSRTHLVTRSKMMECKELESSDGVDVLRSLPKNVLEDILTRLPIKDAVRTSTLSRSWRYEWNTLPSIIFDSPSFPFPRGQDQIEFDSKIVKIVDQVLLLHQGPIHTFKFSVDIKSWADMDRWILYLSGHGISSFTLFIWKVERYTLPSCLFSCVDMKYLELFCCNFVPPHSFKGFGQLTEMDIEYVDFAEQALTVLMSHLPHLKKLRLWRILGFTPLKLCARELECLSLRGYFDDIHIKSAPLLADVYMNLVSIASKSSCRIHEVLGSLPSISRLELDESTLRNLAVGDIPECIGGSFPLKHLIVHINFEDLQQMLAAFCIFRSSLLLKKLHILIISRKNKAATSSEGFWGGGDDLCCTFSHLQTVVVYCFTGIPSEVKFIQFLLENAPVLETLRIGFDFNMGNKFSISRELRGLRRLSPYVEIIMSI